MQVNITVSRGKVKPFPIEARIFKCSFSFLSSLSIVIIGERRYSKSQKISLGIELLANEKEIESEADDKSKVANLPADPD